MSNIKELNKELEEKSIFGKLFDNVKNISGDKLKNVGMALGGSVILGLMAGPLSNAYIQDKLMDNLDKTQPISMQIKSIGDAYSDNLQNNNMFVAANTIATHINKLFVEDQTYTNAQLYLQTLSEMVTPYASIKDVENKIKLIEDGTKDYLKNMKIASGTKVESRIKEMAIEQIKPLKEEIAIRKIIEDTYLAKTEPQKELTHSFN